ncbi:hypothetical protein VCR26J2_660025 [Vibrio coralliirubri]|nr:hypothetical protein VCR26J2_660025 [Vibrio coralliirubri]
MQCEHSTGCHLSCVTARILELLWPNIAFRLSDAHKQRNCMARLEIDRPTRLLFHE